MSIKYTKLVQWSDWCARGRSLDSMMAWAQTRQEARQLCLAMLLNKQPKQVPRTPKLLIGPLTLHHLTWI